MCRYVVKHRPTFTIVHPLDTSIKVKCRVTASETLEEPFRLFCKRYRLNYRRVKWDCYGVYLVPAYDTAASMFLDNGDLIHCELKDD